MRIKFGRNPEAPWRIRFALFPHFCFKCGCLFWLENYYRGPLIDIGGLVTPEIIRERLCFDCKDKGML